MPNRTDPKGASSLPSKARALNRYSNPAPVSLSHGHVQVTLSADASVPLTIPSVGSGTLNLLESVEAAHADLAFNNRVSQLLGITRAPTRMDSQAKYGCLARGDGGVYLRMPTGTGYQEKIWVSHVPVWVRLYVEPMCRITLLGLCSFRNAVVSSRIHGVNVLTLDLGGLWGRIMVSLLLARTSMYRSWLLFSKRWQRSGLDDPNPNKGF